MQPLTELQRDFSIAVTGGDAVPLLPGLRAPAALEQRLEIYRRHHRESFRRHFRGRYPTLEWLLGTDRLVALADATLRDAPPRSPSLAEYGRELVKTAAADPDLPPYAAEVARLDWALGCVSVAVSAPPLAIAALAAIAPQELAQVTLRLQPGLAFLASGWPVDDLVHLRLGGNAPDELVFTPQPVFLQLDGARGRFAIRRLDPGSFAFRAALRDGLSLAAATGQGAAAHAGFDLAAALAALFADSLVTSHSG